MVKDKQIAYKFKVTQEYEVIIYYPQGVVGDTKEDIDMSVIDDTLNLVFSHEGLVIMDEEANDNANSYIGLVTTFDPDIEESYNIKEMPSQIKQALAERGLLDKKE